MSIHHSNSLSAIAERRGEILAELFFQELDPVFLSRPTSPDVGYDLLVGFKNRKGGINTFAVEVRSTDRPPRSPYSIPRSTRNLIAHSNVPGLLLVADAKQNRLYYAWLRSNEGKRRGSLVSIPIIEIDAKTKEELKKEFHKSADGVAVAG